MINNPDTDRYKKKWNYHIESMKKLILDMNDNEKADFYAWWQWSLTPDPTHSGWSAHYVRYVDNDGNVNYNDYDYSKSVRPFWDGRRNIVGETPLNVLEN